MNDQGNARQMNMWQYLREYGIPAAIGAVAATITQLVITGLYDALSPQLSWAIIGGGAILAILLSHIAAIRAFISNHQKLLLGILVTLAGFSTSLAVAPALRGRPPCPAPTELRLVTAPENVPELRARAAQYAAANRIDGCPSLRMTVAAAPPPVHLQDAFANSWERLEDRRGQPYARLYDLQPDAWVATSSAAPAELREGGLRTLGRGGEDPLVGQDQLVLAMTERRREELDRLMKNPDVYPLSEVWDTLRFRMGMTIARPFPETSMSALLGTGDLYRGLGLSPAGYSRLEQELVTDGLGADTVSSLLCAFHRLSGDDAAGAARTVLLVPGHSVADFNAGRVDGCPGTGRGERLIAVRHHEFSTLDYRYVTVTWPGQPSQERRALVEGFGAWLRQHPLFPNVPVAGRAQPDVKELSALKKLLLDDLRPQLDLRLMVDLSGSADRPVRVRAAEALRGQSRILGPRDRVEVFGLSSPREGGPAELAPLASQSTRNQLGVAAAKIEDALFDRWDAPASWGVRLLGTGDEVVPAPALLLTDGRLFDNEDGDPAAAIEAALRETPSVSGLYVIVFGQNRCAVPKLEEAATPYACVPADGDAAGTVTRAVITMRGWR